MTLPAEVTVIGAGIVGSIASCLLHDRGLRVRIVDSHDEPMSATSRWNEGKLHLGYTYTGTESLETARLMIEGTSHFERILAGVCGGGVDAGWWSHPITYIVDRDSIFPVDVLWKRATAVGNLIKQAALRHEVISRYQPLTPQRLTDSEASSLGGGKRNAAAWVTGERAISTQAVADLVAAAVRRRGIDVQRATVCAVRRTGRRWFAQCCSGSTFESDALINCSWESRWLLDRTLDCDNGDVSIRYKVALFGADGQLFSRLAPTTRILGAFGDVTPYADGHAYLSWYPAGLLACSEDGSPPAVPGTIDRDAMISSTLAALGLSEFRSIEWNVRGGFVVAVGKGLITDPRSMLHTRHHARAQLLAPNYVSVDTGKYTIGPLLAEQVVEMLLAGWSS